MPKPLAINTDLRPDVQATLHDVADRIRDRLQLTIKNIIEIGHDLHAAKKALGRGRFRAGGAVDQGRHSKKKAPNSQGLNRNSVSNRDAAG